MFRLKFTMGLANWTDFEFSLNGDTWEVLGLNVMDNVWIARRTNISNVPPAHPLQFTDDELLLIWAKQVQSQIETLIAELEQRI